MMGYHAQSLRFGLAFVPSIICTRADRAESQVAKADACRKENAAKSPTVTTNGSGCLQGSRRLCGIVTTTGAGFNVPQAVTPSAEKARINGSVSAGGLLDNLDRMVGPLANYADFGCVGVERLGRHV
jgi:hypothetical protein